MVASAPRFASATGSARLVVFLLAFVSTAYFVHGAGANQNTRFDLVRAIVEGHSLRIDAYQANTMDKAIFGGHHYSDKAPGLAFAAVVPYAVLHAMDPGDPSDIEPDPAVLHLLTLATVSLVSALAGVAMLGLLESLGVGLLAGAVTVVAWLLGTNAFFYGGTFVSHQFSASLLVLGFAALQRAGQRAGRAATGWNLAAGGLLGWAMLSEFTVAPTVALLLLYAAIRQGWRRVLLALGSCCVPMLLLGWYQWQCFGSPLRLGYGQLASAHFRGEMGRGFFGLVAPSAQVAGELLWGRFRGFLPLSPFLLLAVPGFVQMFRLRQRRLEALLCLLSAGSAVLVASSYRIWNGGAALGPRHLVHALPFLVIPVGFAVADGLRSAQRVAVAIGVALLVASSIATVTVAVAVMPEFPEPPGLPAPLDDMAPFDGYHPFEDFALPCFLRGAMSLKATQGGHIVLSTWVDKHDGDAFNLGEAVGLRGLSSLVPLLLFWLAAVAGFVWLLRVQRRQQTDLDDARDER